jgi:hypothetical protein
VFCLFKYEVLILSSVVLLVIKNDLLSLVENCKDFSDQIKLVVDNTLLLTSVDNSHFHFKAEFVLKHLLIDTKSS